MVWFPARLLSSDPRQSVPAADVLVSVESLVTAGGGMTDPPSLSPPRLSNRGPAPPVPHHPRQRPELYPPAAAAGVDHNAALHRPGHHLPHHHLWPDGDVALALRGLPLRTLDGLPGEYVFPLFPSHPVDSSFANLLNALVGTESEKRDQRDFQKQLTVRNHLIW